MDHERALRRTQTKLERTAVAYEDATLARNQAIRRAVAAGWTTRQVGAVTGLSVERVRQISKRVEHEHDEP